MANLRTTPPLIELTDLTKTYGGVRAVAGVDLRMDVDLRRRFWRAMREFVAADGTVLFTTHHLDEADEVADRVILLSAGRVVADGTGAEIRGRVAGRTISLAADGPDASALAELPGVVHLGRAAARWQVHTTDSDQTLRALLEHGGVHDVEITSATLEEAFVALTTPPARLERTPA